MEKMQRREAQGDREFFSVADLFFRQARDAMR
jgi:hypothetical protein